jgi:hypothetical protein
MRDVAARFICNICGSFARPTLSYRVRASEVAELNECDRCGFHFIADPVWLEGSFGEKLNRFDVGSADRSLMIATFVRSLVRRRSLSTTTVLDFGGGDGLSTRVLRDHGVDCRWEDPFCEPVFCVGPSSDDVGHFDLAFMGEVALHLVDPMPVFRTLLQRSDRILFTAVVPPEHIEADWWYLMPETGQHVAFFPVRALRHMAKSMSVYLLTDGRFFHQFSTKRPSLLERALFRFPAIALLRGKLIEVSDLARRAIGRGVGLTELDQSRVV